MSDLVDLTLTREFTAPVDRLYAAFVDPDLLSAWFGPVGFSVPRDIVDVDARVGGHQRFVMVGDADPTQRSEVNATFLEVVENTLLVGQETVVGAAPDGSDMTLRLRLSFVSTESGSRLDLVQGPYPAEWIEPATGGWMSSFTKLDALL